MFVVFYPVAFYWCDSKKKKRFVTLREIGKTWFTINGLRKGKIGNLVAKILKEFARCNMQFDREGAEVVLV
jgi:hypothetical protein